MMSHKVYIHVYLLLEKDQQILLSLRQNTGYADGQWGLVSGHGESQETVRQALIREAEEEIGITIKEEDLTIVHVMHRRSDRECVEFFIKCRAFLGEISNKEPHKCGDVRFFEKDNLPDTIVPYIPHALKNIDEGITYSEYGWDHAH